MTVKISVIITAYNRRQFINEAIDSVLAQKFDHSLMELIVVTNYYVDTSIYENQIDIKHILMSGTIGQFLCAGIGAARNEVVAFLDDDDIWIDSRTDRLAGVFQDKKVTFYHNLYHYVNANGNEMKYRRNVERRNLDIFKEPLVFDPYWTGKKIKLALEMRSDFNLSCIAVRRDFALKNMGLLKKIEGAPDGFFFWIAVLSAGTLFIDSKPMVKYRVHKLNVSGNSYYGGKILELAREIKTFDLLISILENAPLEENRKKLTKKYLTLYKNGYSLISSIFEERDRAIIIKNMIGLIRDSFGVRIVLKQRIIALALLSLLSSKIAKYIYTHL
jgi:glycosyltransferase involved in cell wall biosynthesis